MKLASKIFRRTDWYVTSPYGYRKVNKAIEIHNGTDYGTNKQNWKLYAIEPGVVTSCGQAGDGAIYVWVNYPRLGKKLLHYHLSDINVTPGQEVQEGTLLGYAGDTGSASGIHLHLGMQPSNASIYENPHAYEYSYAKAIMNTAATVYGGPSAALYAPIGSVFNQGQIQVINRENDFYFIRYWTDKLKLKRGYVAVSQVKIDPLIQIVDVTKTFKGNNNLVYPQSTIYAHNNLATAAPLGTVSEYVSVTEFTPPENNMHFIEYGTSEGIKRGYIQSNELIRREGGLAIAIASNGTNVYYTPDFESQAGAVGANEYVALLQTDSTTSYIEYNTKNGRARGYASNDSLQLLDADDVPGLPYYVAEPYTPTGFLTVYFGPTEKYAVVGSINQGAVLTRLSPPMLDDNDDSPMLNTDDYSFIQYSTAEGTKRGYVKTSGLVAMEIEAPSPDDNASFDGDMPKPVSMSIERIGLKDVTVIPVGIDGNTGHMLTPPEAKGVTWYEQYASPGWDCNAILSGHNYFNDVEGSFVRLNELVLGDQVEFTYEDGSVGRFTVFNKERYNEDEVPASIMLNEGLTRTTLITCEGQRKPEGGFPYIIVLQLSAIEHIDKDGKPQPIHVPQVPPIEVR
ncbi:MAG: peptidoglycan DD-metalloendopeptidase family protein [Peptococcaceae bacterium]|nr:peptidoglycan DD-metalloendopeptidase family protein [Peptococcaceae bacterium]